MGSHLTRFHLNPVLAHILGCVPQHPFQTLSVRTCRPPRLDSVATMTSCAPELCTFYSLLEFSPDVPLQRSLRLAYSSTGTRKYFAFERRPGTLRLRRVILSSTLRSSGHLTRCLSADVGPVLGLRCLRLADI